MTDESFEDCLRSRFGTLGGMDEVGRGCLAGPACAGLVVPGEGPKPSGLTDSKRLTEKRREALYEPILLWSRAAAVGWASAAEVDRLGIIGALRIAGLRAFAEVQNRLGADSLRVILLDGNHDWLSGEHTLWDAGSADELPPVYTRVKADLTCVSVSAASVIAKVSRDRYMRSLVDPGYDWASNKGYGSVKHRDAIRKLGPSEQHRQTWNLLGD